MADISKITLPSGDAYNFKDAKARENIDAVEDRCIKNETLSPTAFDSLSPYKSRCTIEAGGFVKIGRMVYVDVTITMATGASSSSFTAVIADRLEIAPLKGAYSILTAVNNTSRATTTKALIGANGNILICNASSGELVYITGCYISKT